ncbi:MAG: tripartite tricarboxylate transporter TctB family protein [Hyphomicrobiaceae bacterium]
MTNQSARPIADMVLSVIVVVVAIAIYLESLGLPPAHWEPLGSAALPQALCLCMSFFAVIIFIRAALTLRAQKTVVNAAACAGEQAVGEQDFQRRPWAAAAMFVMLAAYVAVMHAGLLGFVEATFIFLVSVCLLFTKGNRKHIPWIVLFALVIAIGNYVIFTKFLYIDLPETSWL